MNGWSLVAHRSLKVFLAHWCNRSIPWSTYVNICGSNSWNVCPWEVRQRRGLLYSNTCRWQHARPCGKSASAFNTRQW
jgi:hypothetical protein